MSTSITVTWLAHPVDVNAPQQKIKILGPKLIYFEYILMYVYFDFGPILKQNMLQIIKKHLNLLLNIVEFVKYHLKVA